MAAGNRFTVEHDFRDVTIMIWIVVGCLALGFGFCGISVVVMYGPNPDGRDAAPLYLMPGIILIALAFVIAIGNAAVKALL